MLESVEGNVRLLRLQQLSWQTQSVATQTTVTTQPFVSLTHCSKSFMNSRSGRRWQGRVLNSGWQQGVLAKHGIHAACLLLQEQIRVLTQRRVELTAAEEAAKASPEEQREVLGDWGHC